MKHLQSMPLVFSSKYIKPLNLDTSHLVNYAQDKTSIDMKNFQISNMFKLQEFQHQAFEQFMSNKDRQDYVKNMTMYVDGETRTRKTHIIKVFQ
jgi:hypothetical protein